MAKLTFKNAQLQEVLRRTQESKTFKVTFGEAVQAYEKATGKEWQVSDELDKYYEPKPEPKLWLVKDHGIYLMSAGTGHEPAADGSHICYAKGYEPVGDDWWEKVRNAVGGDDFVEPVNFPPLYQEAVKNGADIIINITATRMTFAVQLPKAKTASK